MGYSSIIQKPCKCGCGNSPTLGFQGYYSGCRPDLVAEKIKKNNSRQYQKGKLSKALREQIQNGDMGLADRQALINDLDWVVSRYIRMMYAEPVHGMLACFTCPTVKHFSLMQNGHFIPRAHMQTRFLVKNLRPQCPACNEGKHGNLEVFAENLEKEESGVVEYLQALSREPYKFTTEELKQTLIDFRAKLRLIETKFKPR